MTEQWSDAAEVVNVTRIIDEGPVSTLLIRVATLCATVAFLVGLDTSSINVAGPLIAEALRLPEASLGPIFSAALLGSLLGALGFGTLADRFGRRRMLMIAVLIMSVFTLATGVAGSFRSLMLIRFLAGVGLGGATPCFITLACEYAPRSRRATVTSLMWTAFPFGVISGAFLNALLLSRFGWQSIFLVGGVFPIVILVVLAISLPESIRFLLAKNRDAAAVRRIVSHFVPSLSAGARIVADEEAATATPGPMLILRRRTAETIVLWIACLTVFGTGLGVFFWSPTLMHEHGISLARASTILGMSGIGALTGSAIAGRLIGRFGATVVLGPALLFGALAVAALGHAAASPTLMTFDLLATSTLIGGIGSSGVLAVAGGLYPTAMRSTGLGWATGMGRLGELTSPLLTGTLLSAGWRLDQVFVLTAFILAMGAMCIIGLGWYAGRARIAWGAAT